MTDDLVFGSRSLSIDELKVAVEPVSTNVAFELHESDMMGGDYWLVRGPGNETWQIHLNQPEDDEPECLIEPDFPDYPTLLRVHVTERADELEVTLRAVDGLDFLRREG
jgi:hypothetical protein